MDSHELKMGAVAVLVVVGVGALAFWVGRTTAPETVRYEEKWQLRETEKIRWEKYKVINLEQHTDSSTHTRKNVKTKETVNPDGSRVIETVDNTEIDTNTKTDTKVSQTESEKGSSDKTTSASGSASQTTEKGRPDWQFTVFGGLDLDDTHYAAPPTTYDWKAGIMVERRILGGFKLGLWGMSDASAGIAASLEL